MFGLYVGMTVITVLSKYYVSSCVIQKIKVQIVLYFHFHVLNNAEVSGSFLLLLNLSTPLSSKEAIIITFL